jgi:uncharacterized protein (TIRG00374 family)
MVSTEYKVTWKTYLLLVLGLVAFLIYIYLFNVDIQQIIATAERHFDVSIYALAAAFAILGTFLFSLSWHFLLKFLSVKISVARSFFYVWYGIFVDAVIPGESLSGEITKLYLITREDGTVSGKVVASLVAQRLMGMTVNIISLLVGMSVLLTVGGVSGIVLSLTIFLVTAISIFLVLLIILCIKEKWTLKIVNTGIGFVEYLSRGHWKPQLTKIREEVVRAARMFHDSMKKFRHAPKTLFASMSANAISWILELGVIYLVFLSVGFSSVQWGTVIVTCSMLVAIKSIPVGVPFEAGLPEIAMSTLFIWLGVPKEISFTVTILSRLLTMWLRFFIGFGVQQWIEIRKAKSPSTENNMVPLEQKKPKSSFDLMLKRCLKWK